MKRGYKECPFCKNEIKKEAIKCQYCHEFLNDQSDNKTEENTNKIQEKNNDKPQEKKDKCRYSFKSWYINFFYLENKRITRSQYYILLGKLSGIMIICYIIGLCIIWIFSLLYKRLGENSMYVGMTIWGGIRFVLSIWCSILLIKGLIRRNHDMGFSGLRSLWVLIPFINGFVILEGLCRGSKNDNNKYGEQNNRKIKKSEWVWPLLFIIIPIVISFVGFIYSIISTDGMSLKSGYTNDNKVNSGEWDPEFKLLDDEDYTYVNSEALDDLRKYARPIE